MTDMRHSFGRYDSMSDAELLEEAAIYGINPAMAIAIAEHLAANTTNYSRYPYAARKYHFRFNEGAQA